MEIIPAILESEIEAVAEKVAIVQADHNFGTVQIDIGDGELIERLTVTPLDLLEVDFGELKIDFHLMCEEPLDYLWEIAANEAGLRVRAAFGQVERMGDQSAFLKAAQERGYKAGLALDLETPLESIDESAWANLDEVLLLAVPMGSQDQEFNESIYEKITQLQKEIEQRKLRVEIVIDGGIKLAQLQALNKAGVEKLAIGSYLWSGGLNGEQIEADE